MESVWRRGSGRTGSRLASYVQSYVQSSVRDSERTYPYCPKTRSPSFINDSLTLDRRAELSGSPIKRIMGRMATNFWSTPGHRGIAGIVREPYEDWMFQVLRNLTDGVDGFLLPHHYLFMDRDPVFTQEFRARLARAGVEPIRLPGRSPNLNAFVERFNRSIKEECLDRVVPLGEAHLRELVREYVAHDHEERPHQGLSSRLIAAATGHRGRGPLARRQRPGGLLNHYDREAA